MHRARSTDLDKILYEWLKQCRSEGVSISGSILIEKAKQFREELKICDHCNFSIGWFHKCKLCRSIRYLKMGGEKLSIDRSLKSASQDFSKLVKDEQLTPKQMYNVNENGLFWHCIPH